MVTKKKILKSKPVNRKAKTVKPKPKSKPNTRHFKQPDYARIEMFAKSGYSDTKICKALPVSKETFIKWKADPKVKAILTDARKGMKANPSAPGPDTIYHPKFCSEMIKYFDIEPYEKKTEVTTTKDEVVTEKEYLEANDLPLLSKFATKIGVHRETLRNWAEVHPEFNHAYKMCVEMQSTNLITNGLRGLYNPSYAGLVSKNWLNMKDKKDVTTNDKPIKPNCYVIPAFNNNIDEPDDSDSES